MASLPLHSPLSPKIKSSKSEDYFDILSFSSEKHRFGSTDPYHKNGLDRLLCSISINGRKAVAHWPQSRINFGENFIFKFTPPTHRIKRNKLETFSFLHLLQLHMFIGKIFNLNLIHIFNLYFF